MANVSQSGVASIGQEIGLNALGTNGLYGEKIRSALANAYGRNPVELSPLSPAPTYAASTIYGAGTVVRGSGADANNLYLCVGSTTNINARGTSGAASPPTGISNANITDNNITWFYIGKTSSLGTYPLYSTVIPAVSTDVMTGYVAFVANSAVSTLGLTRSYTNNRTGAGPFARMGGHIRFDTTQAYIEPLSNWIGTLSGGNYSGNRAFMEFTTSAQQWIGLQCLANMNGAYAADGTGRIDHYDIIVNGQRLSESMIAFNNLGTAGGATPGSSASTLILDLTKFGNGNKTIRITSHGPNWGFQAPYLVFVKADEAVWATTPANNFKVSVEGDSIAQGGYFGQNFARWLIEHEIMDLLGFTRCINTAIGGTSCTNLTNGGKTLSTQGSASTVNTTFGERIRFITESGIPDIHVIFGFHNEVNNYQTAGLLARRKAILQYMQDCRAAWPNALIVVLPFAPLTGDSYTTGGSQSLFDLEADVFNQFTTFGDANSLFIPTQSASFPFYSTASASTTSWYHSAGGSAPYNDSHPVTRFYPVFARVIADAIRRFYQI